ncbi:unnamed protein product [Pseudo-nitzschia multistriata]|uniref:BTB domain-containing protein n=1 Tax=Pseudo-nitzschia multistriata TaxID=183589 RepID=A0A448ZBF6_9STRA|nr:unnamed protein product [Pseudo-nitzschia multistriata]
MHIRALRSDSVSSHKRIVSETKTIDKNLGKNGNDISNNAKDTCTNSKTKSLDRFPLTKDKHQKCLRTTNVTVEVSGSQFCIVPTLFQHIENLPWKKQKERPRGKKRPTLRLNANPDVFECVLRFFLHGNLPDPKELSTRRAKTLIDFVSPLDPVAVKPLVHHLNVFVAGQSSSSVNSKRSLMLKKSISNFSSWTKLVHSHRGASTASNVDHNNAATVSGGTTTSTNPPRECGDSAANNAAKAALPTPMGSSSSAVTTVPTQIEQPIPGSITTAAEVSVCSMDEASSVSKLSLQSSWTQPVPDENSLSVSGSASAHAHLHHENQHQTQFQHQYQHQFQFQHQFQHQYQHQHQHQYQHQFQQHQHQHHEHDFGFTQNNVQDSSVAFYASSPYSHSDPTHSKAHNYGVPLALDGSYHPIAPTTEPSVASQNNPIRSSSHYHNQQPQCHSHPHHHHQNQWHGRDPTCGAPFAQIGTNHPVVSAGFPSSDTPAKATTSHRNAPQESGAEPSSESHATERRSATKMLRTVFGSGTGGTDGDAPRKHGRSETSSAGPHSGAASKRGLIDAGKHAFRLGRGRQPQQVSTTTRTRLTHADWCASDNSNSSSNNKDYSNMIGASLLPLFGLAPPCGTEEEPFRSNNEGLHGRCRPLSLLLDGGAEIPSPTATTTAAGGNHGAAGDGGRSGTHRPRPSPLPQANDRQASPPPTTVATGGRKRILLRGPPRSGKTSMAMDLAYAAAAGAPGSGLAAIVYRPYNDAHVPPGPGGYGHGNRRGDGRGLQGGANDEAFPLRCRPLLLERGGANGPEGGGRAPGASWDPGLLKRIRIRRVSSARELWYELLAMAGRPHGEQPSGAIVVEDMDKLVPRDALPGGRGGRAPSNNQRKWHQRNLRISTLQKTVAIAADTALAIERTLSLPQGRLSLLFTLATHHRGAYAAFGRREAGDLLASTACIDAVVTLLPKPPEQKGSKHQSRAGAIGSDWKAPVARNRGGSCTETTRVHCGTDPTRNPYNNSSCSKNDDNNTNNKNKSNSNAGGEESIFVHSLWQAQFQDRRCDSGADEKGNDRAGGTSLMDYAFVESFPADDDDIDDDDDDDSTDEYESDPLELRWKHRGAYS